MILALRHRIGGFLLLLMLVTTACAVVSPELPTDVPTRGVSGPTLEPSPTVLNLLPSALPPDFVAPGQTIPEAQGLPANGELPPLALTPAPGDLQQGLTRVQLTLGNGQTLTGDLYENPPIETEQGFLQQRLPGVLLIGASRSVWGGIPARIRDFGYTVLVVDVGTFNTSDILLIILKSFSETSTVNPGLMAVIGAGQGADLALIGCALDRICDAVVLLGPQGRDTLLNIMPDYNPRPLMLIASTGDNIAYQTVTALRDAAIGSVELREYEGERPGIDIIIEQPELVTAIIDWLERFLVP